VHRVEFVSGQRPSGHGSVAFRRRARDGLR
jgi:hypothetical protein